jgi:hypothetical protein
MGRTRTIFTTRSLRPTGADSAIEPCNTLVDPKEILENQDQMLLNSKQQRILR